MKRAFRRSLALAAGSCLMLLAATLASCATVEKGDGPPDDPSLLPEGGADAGVQADADLPADGGCDDADPRCVTDVVTCEEASFCPVAADVGPYALMSVWGSKKDDVWAVGAGGTILRWDGVAWKSVPPPTPAKNTFRVVWGSSPNDVWIASGTDTIFRTPGYVNGTVKWMRAPNPTGDEFVTPPLFAVWGNPGGAPRFGARSFVLFDDEGIHHFNRVIATTDGEDVAWEPETGTATIKGIWASSDDDVWLVGDNSESTSWQLGWTMHGTRTMGGELEWVEVDSQAGVVLQAVWGSSADDVWAVGDQGTIRRIRAGDTRWQVVESPTRAALHAIWGSAADDVWAVGEDGTIMHWDGKAWRPAVAAFPVHRRRPHLYGVWGSGPNDVWIVGDGIVLRHTGGGK